MHMRNATSSEMATLMAMASAEGWNPGRDDGLAFYEADPNGFFVTEIDGGIKACISVVNHDDDHAFLGLYICAPEYRGKGIGKALWDFAIQHAEARHIGLDGVLDQQDNYQKSGFDPVIDTCRYDGQIRGETNPNVRLATADDIPLLIDLDASANGLRRAAMMTEWTASNRPRRKTVLFDDRSGFATIRKCEQGVKIGPVICNNTDDALILIKAALYELPSNQAIIDVHADRVAMVATLTDLGFRQTFVAARMYKGTAPHRSDMLLAVACMELG